MKSKGEQTSTSKPSRKESDTKSATKVTKKDSQSEPRKCYFCGKPGHFIRDCHKLKKLKKGQTANSATADQKTAPKPLLDRSNASSARNIDILEPSPEHGEEEVDLTEPSPEHGEKHIDLRSTSGSSETTKRGDRPLSDAQYGRGSTSTTCEQGGIADIDRGHGVCTLSGPTSTYYLPGQVEKQKVLALLDTGSSLNIVSRSVFKKLPPSVTSKLRQSTYQGITAAGQVLPFDGLITLSGRLRTVPFTAEFAVSDIS